MQDMTGTPVDLGDYLLDSRGHLHVVRHTDTMMQAEKVIYTYDQKFSRRSTQGAQSFLREGFCLRVDPEALLWPQRARTEAWRRAFDEYRGPVLEAENAERKAILNEIRARRGIA